jgi:hypothetical protein
MYGWRYQCLAFQAASNSYQHARDFPWPVSVLATPHCNPSSLARPGLDDILLLTQHYNFCTFCSPLQYMKLTGHKQDDAY